MAWRPGGPEDWGDLVAIVGIAALILLVGIILWSGATA